MREGNPNTHFLHSPYTFHSKIVLSALALAKLSPSGLNFKSRTSPWWPCRHMMGALNPDVRLIVWIKAPLFAVFPELHHTISDQLYEACPNSRRDSPSEATTICCSAVEKVTRRVSFDQAKRSQTKAHMDHLPLELA